MPWSFEPIALAGRWHPDADGSRRRARWPTGLTVTFLTPGTVFLSHLRGDEFTRQMREELEADLSAMGVHTVLRERHGELEPVPVRSISGTNSGTNSGNPQ